MLSCAPICHGSDHLADEGFQFLFWRRDCYEVRQQTLRTQNELCPPDRRRPNPLHVYSDKQCSTLVDNVLSRHACKQCCDVQHVGLGYVGPFCVLPFLLPSVSSLYVPVRFLMVDLLLCFQKGSRYFEFPTL